MKKTTRKKIICFLSALVSTVLIGLLVLFIYASMQTPAEYRPVPEVIPTDVQTEAPVDGEAEAVADVQEEIFADKQESVTVSENGCVTMVFGGDVCFHDPFANMNALTQRGGGIDKCISADLLERMKMADICMVNNEFPYSDRGTPIEGKAFAFRSKPENVRLLKEMGVDVVSLANNHAYDHGEAAFLDTLETLEGAGVDYVGAGRDLKEASEAVFYEIQGVKIAILAATQIERLDMPDTKGATENSAGVLRCFNEKELEHFLDMVSRTKEECDVLIVYIHWGTENTEETDWAQPYQAELISKAGADIIIGAHPHCLQGIDCINGVPVIYSLGNYWFNSKTVDTALLEVVAGREGLKTVRVIPARQQDCSTSMLYDGEKKAVLDYLQGLSPGVSLDAEGFLTWNPQVEEDRQTEN